MNRVYDLRCSGMETPRAVDSIPLFSWKYELDNGFQTGYELTVRHNKEIVWQTGYIESIESCHIPYEGPCLEFLTEYEWYVMISGSDGSMASSKDTFRTGFLGKPWTGRWIAACFHKKPDDSKDAPYIRKSFNIEGEISSAQLYICSPGYYDAYINGISVGDDILATPYTAFDRTLFYSTYDVTHLLKTGDNTFGSLIGTGWYNCFTKDVWNTPETSWRHVPKMIAEIHVEFAKGTSKVISTDNGWRCKESPVIFNGIRNGEYYDARLEIENWCGTELDDSSWNHVRIVRAPGGTLKAMEMEPERIVDSWEPVSCWQTPEGTWIFDAGVNTAGFSEITIEGAKGSEITIRYSERLDADRVHIDPKTNSGFVKSGEFQTDKYIKKGDGTETWSPKFVYHGFQYIGIEGCGPKPGMIVHKVNSDVADTGYFECSDETLNKIHEAARRATLSNLHSVPTDDPHREKNAWTGDVALSTEQMLYNFKTAPILRKWLGDIRDSQRPDGAIPCVVPSTGWGYNWGNGPDWSSALTLIPWWIYVMTGDMTVIEENYEAIKKHFGYMESMDSGGIVHYGIGDWCPPFEGRAVSVSMSSFKTPTEVTDTAYYFNAAKTISKMASVLGKDNEAASYEDKAIIIKQAFRDSFFDGDRTVTGDCQTSTSCMIYQELAEEDEIGKLRNKLVHQIAETDYHQDTGILGNKYLYNVLGEEGLMDLALRMILNDTYPSFKNWINMGATTLWECWNGEGSRNHHMFSDLSAVLYKYIAGIKPDEKEPGFRHIIMKPALDCGLAYASASHVSPYGNIKSRWELTDRGVEIDITIPCGSIATLTLPDHYDMADYNNELRQGRHRFSVRRLAIKEGLKRYYNEYVDVRNSMIKDEWKIKLRDKVMESFEANGVRKVLEIGCGTGQDSLYMMKKGFKVNGIDLSEAHIEKCLENGVDACVMDLYDMDFENGYFDAVYSMNCLLHVPKAELETVIKEVMRIVRPGGILFIGNYSGSNEGFRKLNDQAYGRFFSFRDHENDLSLYIAAGCEIIEAERLNPMTQRTFNSYILRKK